MAETYDRRDIVLLVDDSPEALGFLTEALEQLDPAVRAALEESIRRARTVHRAQRRTTHTTQVVPGGTVTEKWVPVERVGLYAPGGRSVYPSSVIMNVVPAQEAGVPSIALASPAQAEFDGLPHPTILAACALLGVDEVYAAGGATAVAMFAYGTESCPPAPMVTGPGNIWVAAAKRYFALDQRLLEMATDMGCADLVEEREDKTMQPAPKLAEDDRVRDIQSEFQNDVFWHELVQRLADRDIAGEQTKRALETPGVEPPPSREEQLKKIETRYWDEFEKNDLAHVVLLRGGKG